MSRDASRVETQVRWGKLRSADDKKQLHFSSTGHEGIAKTAGITHYTEQNAGRQQRRDDTGSTYVGLRMSLEIRSIGALSELPAP